MSEKDFVKSKLLLHGFDTEDLSFNIDKDILNLAPLLKEICDEEIKDSSLHFYSLKDIVTGFFENKLRLHEVPVINKTIANKIFNKYLNADIVKLDRLYGLQNELTSSTRQISPINIPFNFTNDNTSIATLEKVVFLYPDEEYLQKTPINYAQLNLGNNITKLSASSMIHEVTHTQLERIKGSIEHYYNEDVLPMFLEKVFALETKDEEFLRTNELLRFKELYECLNILKHRENYKVEKLLNAYKRAVSILKAETLYDRYIMGSLVDKVFIMSGIQGVFDGDETVEEYLHKFGATTEYSANIELLKRHL